MPFISFLSCERLHFRLMFVGILKLKKEFDEIVENHSRQEILSLLGEAEPPKKLCAELMDFIDAHEDLKKYWEEHINVDCRKKAE